MWQPCYSGSFPDDNGATSVLHSIRGGPKGEPYMKALCKLQHAPQMFIFLIS